MRVCVATPVWLAETGCELRTTTVFVGAATGAVALAVVEGTTTRETTVEALGCAVVVDLTTTGVELTMTGFEETGFEATGFEFVAGVEYTTRGCE